MLARWLLAGLAVIAHASLMPACAEDFDEDGLDDSLEQYLIDMYRPELFFDSEEDEWPASAIWHVQRSELLYCSDGMEWGIYSQQALYDNPLLLLEGVEQFPYVPSSMIELPQVTGYKLDILDEFQHGEGPIPVGMYAHVVPVRDTVGFDHNGAEPPQCWILWVELTELGLSQDDIHIQYWQFFPFNDAESMGIADHEGDWLYLDVFVDQAPPHDLKFIVHHHHGDGNCPPTILPWDADFPADGIPECYLEDGTHEWWPTPDYPCDCCEWGCNSHDGAGVAFRAENVINLGERYAPMPGIEPQLILFYNGKWGKDTGLGGDPPPGPINQYFPFAPRFVAYVDASAPEWTDEGLGSRYHPYQTFGAAIAAVEESGRVRIAAGGYSGSYTIDRAMTLEVWGDGTVTIGQ